MGGHEHDSGLLPPISGASEFSSAFGVSRETLDRLVTYAELLQKWQQTINLVSPGTLSSAWHRHFADSAQLLGVSLASGSLTGPRWLDLGSGAGFPGLVLAILRAGTGPGVSVLVESDSRKCAFLAEVVRKTGIAPGFTVEIVNARIESAATLAKVGAVDVVTARALAPLSRLLEWGAPYFGPGTRGLLLKGGDLGQELQAAEKDWAFEQRIWPSRTDGSGQVIEVWNLAPKAKGRQP